MGRVRDVDLLLAALAFAGLLVDPVVEGHAADVTPLAAALALLASTAIVVDALVIRTVLVPAVMHLFGRANWYLPAWLDRRLPHLKIDDGVEVTNAPPELARANAT